MATTTAPRIVTLNAGGVKFSSAFKTVVTKIKVANGVTMIVLDALRNVEISLGTETKESLNLQENQQVTVKPIPNSTDGSFQLEIGEVVKPSASSSRGSSPLPGMSLSNSL